MMRSLYTAATGMDAQQTRMDTIANNLANANTTGFKKSRADFEDLLSETLHSPHDAQPQGGVAPVPLQVGLGVRTASSAHSFMQGDALNTGNTFDLMIGGDGFFRVQRPNGDYAYTRAGNFTKDSEGRLVTADGALVSPGITVPNGATNVTIGTDGQVTAQLPNQSQVTNLGRIELATFTNPTGLEALGGNLFTETTASGPATLVRPGEQSSGSIQQGSLENSNVKAIEEMVAMISTQRSYELNSKVIQTADQMLQKLTSLR
jgi:flagellar basal-body rod protein FlgG